MTPTDKKSLAWSCVLHGAILGALCLSVGFVPPEKPKEPLVWLDMATMPGDNHVPEPGNAAPAPPGPAPAPAPTPAPAPARVEPPPPPEPTPAPVVEATPPEPTPPAPTPEPAIQTAPPKPQPVKKVSDQTENKATATANSPPSSSKTVIKKGKRVTRTVGSTSSSGSPNTKGSGPAGANPADKGKGLGGPGSDYSADRFGRLLLGKLPKSEIGGYVWAPNTTGIGTSGKGEASEYGSYFNLIMEKMYAAWHPPFGMSEGMGTKVVLSIERTGVISRVQLDTSSGNQALDDTALAAAHQVRKLPPPPEGLANPTAKVTVFFKIQK